jgi:hypothetical protein
MAYHLHNGQFLLSFNSPDPEYSSLPMVILHIFCLHFCMLFKPHLMYTNFVFVCSDSLAGVVRTPGTERLVSTPAMLTILAKGMKHCF